MSEEKKLTGYPSIDKPWLKYYSEEALMTTYPEKSMYEQLCDCNAYNLGGKALTYFSRSLTYKELIQKIDLVASAFVNIGVHAGDIVNVALPNIPENVYIVYGLNKIGAIANLIDLRTKGENLLHYMTETNAKVAVVCDLFADNMVQIVDKTGIETVIVVSPFDSLPFPIRMVLKKKYKYKSCNIELKWADFLRKAKAGCEYKYKGNADDIVIILHTSGTTGVSKGVMLTNKSVNSMAIQYKVNGMSYESGDVFMNQVPPFLAYNIVLATHLPFCLSMNLRLLPNYEPDKFAKNIAKIKPNHVVAGPADWGNFIVNKDKLVNSYRFLKTLASGSDSMQVSIKNDVNSLLSSRGCMNGIMEGYGMTEVGSAACTNLPTHDVPGSVGVPLPFTNFCIWNSEGEHEMKYGELGEICISGPTLMKGYYGNKEETCNVLKKHADGIVWIHTGDLGYIDNNGNVYLCGRLKRIIVRHDGMKVSPFQIEKVINEIDIVKTCCVVGKNDTIHKFGKIPVAYVVLEADIQHNAANEIIKQHCENELTEIYRPVQYHFLDKLPLTANGKVDFMTLENKEM